MKALFIVIFCFTTSMSFGHEYFFAFAELEYNDITRKFELTLIASTHDVERATENESFETGNLNTESTDNGEDQNVERYLTSHFILVSNEAVCQFHLLGREVKLDGNTNFYLESEAIELSDEITITFDLLMDQFKEQQNKITFYHRNESYTKPFLINKPKQVIKLENE